MGRLCAHVRFYGNQTGDDKTVGRAKYQGRKGEYGQQSKDAGRRQ
jgi:hypothetical protein